MSEWPAYFPDNTPPVDATPASGLSFRLVDNNPPERSDFKSTYEEFAKRKYTSESEFINACGTSHFGQLDDIKRKKRLFPKLRNKHIAKGELFPELGKMKQTFEPSHFTVWYKLSALPQTIFVVLES